MKISATGDAVSFAVHLQPRENGHEIVGEYHDGLEVSVSARPVNDRANEALRKLLAVRLKVPLAAVKIASGERNRKKRVEIHGVPAAMICEPLG